MIFFFLLNSVSMITILFSNLVYCTIFMLTDHSPQLKQSAQLTRGAYQNDRMEQLQGTAGLPSGVDLFLQRPQFLSYRTFPYHYDTGSQVPCTVFTFSYRDQLNQSVLLISYHKLQVINYKVFLITEYCISNWFVTKKNKTKKTDIFQTDMIVDIT